MNDFEKDKQDMIESMLGIFMNNFSHVAGLLSLFYLAVEAENPKHFIENTLNFWADSKKPILDGVIKKSIDVNINPENYDDYEKLVFSSIEPEDYQIAFEKGLKKSRDQIMAHFENFQKNFDK